MAVVEAPTGPVVVTITPFGPDGSGDGSTTDAAGWTADASQKAGLTIRGSSPALEVLPPLADPPPAVLERALQRTHLVTSAPTLDPDTGRPVDWSADDLVRSDWGVVHVIVDGRDVTWWRDTPAIPAGWQSVAPFGDGPADIAFPALTPFDTPGTGDLAWWRPGANVDLVLARPDGTRKVLWSGWVQADAATVATSDRGGLLECTGAVFQAEHAVPRATMETDPIDIGAAIADALTGVVSRRYNPVGAAATGITTRNRGVGERSVLDYVQGLLGTATTSDGTGQWTVARTGPRTYALQLKDRATVHYTVRAGQHGVEADLRRDLTSAPNVIYGRGVGPDGYAWAGWLYPNLANDTAPAYPNSSAGNTITVGETDADTDSGTGVSTWERRARELGHDIPIDGVYSAADALVCRQIQRRYGILVDGIIGPQTWTATFEVGSNGGDLSGAFRMPLAWAPATMPRLYTATGGDAGPNPAYDPGVIRIERDENYGSGISKADGTRSAQAELARVADPGWIGTVRLDIDPAQGSRWEIEAGQNLQLQGYRGSDLLLHIVSAEVTNAGAVTLTVDSKARDYLTVAQLLARDAEAAPDPARRPGKTRRRSETVLDTVVEYDGESAAGRVPRHAIFGGLWNVLRIPVSQVGRIAKIDYRTEGPAAPFVLALFGAPVTAADLVRLVGNPLADGNRNWQLNTEALEDDFGWIETLGGPGQAIGYWPGSESEGDPVTGRHVETGGMEYVSQRPPWIWLAEWSPASCFATGRIYPAPVQ